MNTTPQGRVSSTGHLGRQARTVFYAPPHQQATLPLNERSRMANLTCGAEVAAAENEKETNRESLMIEVWLRSSSGGTQSSSSSKREFVVRARLPLGEAHLRVLARSRRPPSGPACLSRRSPLVRTTSFPQAVGPGFQVGGRG